MITFRLTSDEFERARELCHSRGMSSVSAMARAAINLLVQQPERVEPQALETRVADLETQLHILLLDFTRLKQGADPSSEPELLSVSAKA